MDRREFSKVVGFGVLGVSQSHILAAAEPKRRSAVKVTRTEQKEWARQHFKGFETILMPSFTPDFKSLDEEGIRLDVRQSIAHGFFSVFPSTAGLSPDETKRMLEVCADEAKGKISVALPIARKTVAESTEILHFGEKIGCDHVFLGFPQSPEYGTEESLVKYIRQFADATDLGICLWAMDGSQYQKFHPSNVPMGALDKLADVPNVVALKIMTGLDPAAVFEIYERLGKRLLVGSVQLNMAPLLVKEYGMQWSGAWTVEALQSPEKPYAVDFLNYLMKGKTDQAMKAYWQLLPAYHTLLEVIVPLFKANVHSGAVLKYHQWCVGGNGGYLRPHTGPAEETDVTPKQREMIRAAFKAIGIEPRQNDEEFNVGRMAYARKATSATNR